MWCSNIVYVAFSDIQALYVGMSRNGFARPFAEKHHVISKLRNEISLMQFYGCDRLEDAIELEKYLIKELKPAFNSGGSKVIKKPDLMNLDDFDKCTTKKEQKRILKERLGIAYIPNYVDNHVDNHSCQPLSGMEQLKA
jgi:predicted GIY-YIG superfamily endonuclease